MTSRLSGGASLIQARDHECAPLLTLALAASLHYRRPVEVIMRTLVLSLLVLGACAPDTIIRRTALINAPQAPSREGLPLAKGDVRITAHINTNTAEDGTFFFFKPGIDEVSDPGMLVPEVQLGGSV
jgi:hypothetical protein